MLSFGDGLAENLLRAGVIDEDQAQRVREVYLEMEWEQFQASLSEKRHSKRWWKR